MLHKRACGLLVLLTFAFMQIKANDVIKYSLEEGDDADEIPEILEKLAEHKVTLRKLFGVRSSTSLQSRIVLPGVKEWLDRKIRDDYAAMNVRVAFELLGKVGDLLRISYAGCKGYGCSVKVGLVHSRYQTMIFASARIANLFVKATIRALRYHSYAERQVSKNELGKALTWVKRCGRLADGMSMHAQEMVKMSDNLRAMTENAFNSTLTDSEKNHQEINSFNARMSNITANIKKLREQLAKQTKQRKEVLASLNKAKTQAEDWEKLHKGEADRRIETKTVCTTTKSGGFFGIGSSSTKTCTTELDKGDIKQKEIKLEQYEKQIVLTRNRQQELFKINMKIAQLNAELYGQLAASLTRKNVTAGTITELERASQSLQISIVTLAMVKTIFLSALQFWQNVGDNAKELGSKGDTNQALEEMGADEPEYFTELLVESGFSWMALGRVTNEAAVAMRKVQGHVTAGFIDLPDFAQAKKLIATCDPMIKETQKLLDTLRKQREVTSEEMKKGLEATKMEEDLGVPKVEEPIEGLHVPV